MNSSPELSSLNSGNSSSFLLICVSYLEKSDVEPEDINLLRLSIDSFQKFVKGFWLTETFSGALERVKDFSVWSNESSNEEPKSVDERVLLFFLLELMSLFFLCEVSGLDSLSCSFLEKKLGYYKIKKSLMMITS
jgi:hypothetical protein